MTIQPSISQTVDKYIEIDNTGIYNQFICFPNSYRNAYIIIKNIEVGIDLSEAGLIFTWDLPNQILTIQATDQTFNLQESTFNIDPYTDNETVVSIGKNDIQPADLWIVEFYFNVEIGDITNFTNISFTILERKDAIPSNPADPREIGVEVNAIFEYTLESTMNVASAISGTFSNFNVLSHSFANIIATFSQVANVLDSFTRQRNSNFTTSPQFVRRSNLSGNDYIENGIYRYKNCGKRFGNETTTSTPTAVVVRISGATASACSYLSCTEPTAYGSNLTTRNRLFSTENGLIFGFGKGMFVYLNFTSGNTLDYVYISDNTTSISSYIERWNTMDSNICPDCSIIMASWNSDNLLWEGMSPAEALQLPKVYNQIFSIGQSYNEANLQMIGGQNQGISSVLQVYNLTNNIGYIQKYIDYSQAQCIALDNTTGEGLTVQYFTTGNFTHQITPNPALLTDLTKIKTFARSVNASPQQYNSTYNPIIQYSSAGSIFLTNTQYTNNAPTSSDIQGMERIGIYLYTFQQYDLDGKLIPY